MCTHDKVKNLRTRTPRNHSAEILISFSYHRKILVLLISVNTHKFVCTHLLTTSQFLNQNRGKKFNARNVLGKFYQRTSREVHPSHTQSPILMQNSTHKLLPNISLGTCYGSLFYHYPGYPAQINGKRLSNFAFSVLVQCDQKACIKLTQIRRQTLRMSVLLHIAVVGSLDNVNFIGLFVTIFRVG